jgi:hypothetical protein
MAQTDGETVHAARAARVGLRSSMSDMRLSCRTLTLRTISTFDVRSALIRVFRWRLRQAKEPLAKVDLVVMRSVPQRGSVGSLHPQEFADATLRADATAFRY